MQNGSFHARHELDHPSLADVLDEPVDDRIAQLAVGHLTATEAQTGLYLVALGEEAHGLILFGDVVVIVDGHRELDLFDRDHLLFFAGGPFALFLLIEESAVILDAADWRDRAGRYLYQIEATLPGNLKRLKRR